MRFMRPINFRYYSGKPSTLFVYNIYNLMLSCDLRVESWRQNGYRFDSVVRLVDLRGCFHLIVQYTVSSISKLKIRRHRKSSCIGLEIISAKWFINLLIMKDWSCCLMRILRRVQRIGFHRHYFGRVRDIRYWVDDGTVYLPINILLLDNILLSSQFGWNRVLFGVRFRTLSIIPFRIHYLLTQLTNISNNQLSSSSILLFEFWREDWSRLDSLLTVSYCSSSVVNRVLRHSCCSCLLEISISCLGCSGYRHFSGMRLREPNTLLYFIG